MGILDMLRPAVPDVDALAHFAAQAPVADPGTETGSPLPGLGARAGAVAKDIALSLGAVRKARHVIAGTIGTWTLSAWDGETRLPDTDPRVSWLAQPEPRNTLQWLLTRTVDDLIWHDRSVWRIADRHLSGGVAAVERLHPSRVDTITDPRDPDRVTQWIVDGQPVAWSSLIVIDGAGVGGLQRYGYDLLTIYGQLQAAAGRYAQAPHPHAILKNSGADLTNGEIDALLTQWEAARGTRSVGYLNDVVDYQTFGWNAQELQLTEAREHAALEVARLFGLPAYALDATTTQSQTYANITDRRRDLVAALGPWSAPIEQTLSMADRAGTPRGVAVPRGLAVRFDVTEYTRPDAATRAATWSTLTGAGIITPEQAAALDPLLRSL